MFCVIYKKKRCFVFENSICIEVISFTIYLNVWAIFHFVQNFIFAACCLSFIIASILHLVVAVFCLSTLSSFQFHSSIVLRVWLQFYVCCIKLSSVLLFCSNAAVTATAADGVCCNRFTFLFGRNFILSSGVIRAI